MTVFLLGNSGCKRWIDEWSSLIEGAKYKSIEIIFFDGIDGFLKRTC